MTEQEKTQRAEYIRIMIADAQARAERHSKDLADRVQSLAVPASATENVEEMLTELSRTVETTLPLMTFEEKRRLLDVLRVRVQVVDERHVDLTGFISRVGEKVHSPPRCSGGRGGPL